MLGDRQCDSGSGLRAADRGPPHAFGATADKLHDPANAERSPSLASRNRRDRRPLGGAEELGFASPGFFIGIDHVLRTAGEPVLFPT